ncbi:MAG: glycosyltransferase [Pirellulales bacterium]
MREQARRPRIGIDMLANQSAGRDRGTGRYARGLVRELIERHPEHEYFLYFYRGLAGDDDFRPAGARIRHLDTEGPGRAIWPVADRLARTNPDRLDLLLLSCAYEHFEGYLPPPRRRRGPRMAALLYDLIPTLFPDHYLNHPGVRKAYQQALAATRRYDLLLTISEASRLDCLRIMGMPQARVVNISAASDVAVFGPADGPQTGDGDGSVLLGGLRVQEPFVFSLGAMDYRKNLLGVLEAFRALPERLRERHQLVVAGARSSDDARLLAQQAERLGVHGNLRLIPFPSDDDLRSLYRHAAAFVFPSRYEGFGLPLLEAMQCGAAIVAGNNSSQPEVLGSAALLADVDNPADLAGQLQWLLDDAPLAHRLREQAIRQARNFSWRQTADRCHEALIAALNRPSKSRWPGMLGRFVCHVSPWKPARTRPAGQVQAASAVN